MKNFSLLLICALNAAGAHSQPAKKVGQFSFNGVGTHTCGKYLELTRGLGGSDYKMLYQQWGAGFMAGTSNDNRSGDNPTSDLETYTAWLDKWCTDDPAASVLGGTVALGKRLLKK